MKQNLLRAYVGSTIASSILIYTFPSNLLIYSATSLGIAHVIAKPFSIALDTLIMAQTNVLTNSQAIILGIGSGIGFALAGTALSLLPTFYESFAKELSPAISFGFLAAGIASVLAATFDDYLKSSSNKMQFPDIYKRSFLGAVLTTIAGSYMYSFPERTFISGVLGLSIGCTTAAALKIESEALTLITKEKLNIVTALLCGFISGGANIFASTSLATISENYKYAQEGHNIIPEIAFIAGIALPLTKIAYNLVKQTQPMYHP